ncbi:hypothetical protein A3H75_00780 [Candidatus Uhrbacteria bacterium RIFCSPLOWO2_02_FULL_51_9]|uniref:Uncharacterized protein n=1 Tax=Candidatus Uhrbacteria bacterium RIFCSPLOWO2_02_FULL_51_9 TaxID=1802410 RepID=A0A1F7VDU8_9BACT|nr:MAG: hypothetical protein A3H75_00780 [Candidatus Uhrbacteria bacterium RIFCSPLOWO2_02_FULL_51_9]
MTKRNLEWFAVVITAVLVVLQMAGCGTQWSGRVHIPVGDGGEIGIGTGGIGVDEVSETMPPPEMRSRTTALYNPTSNWKRVLIGDGIVSLEPHQNLYVIRSTPYGYQLRMCTYDGEGVYLLGEGSLTVDNPQGVMQNHTLSNTGRPAAECSF